MFIASILGLHFISQGFIRALILMKYLKQCFVYSIDYMMNRSQVWLWTKNCVCTKYFIFGEGWHLLAASLSNCYIRVCTRTRTTYISNTSFLRIDWQSREIEKFSKRCTVQVDYVFKKHLYAQNKYLFVTGSTVPYNVQEVQISST